MTTAAEGAASLDGCTCVAGHGLNNTHFADSSYYFFGPAYTFDFYGTGEAGDVSPSLLDADGNLYWFWFDPAGDSYNYDTTTRFEWTGTQEGKSTPCVACEPGFFGPGNVSLPCLPCPNATYQSNPSSAS
eukprot:CAMPEP_0113693436 /NCGR_PEP_ID=MMETSP0038_2-20120614/19662_1 /TAXON_ID=2898 /ORGANISM="Cryptomonas paramecium" /LENGTH=129 /DNA_ID=CAMNT_0000615505 /DNA_START=35 /DNA_END=421 /DNA_ORIENTATION=+ /assembly_acc=CAM_ASM_000170